MRTGCWIGAGAGLLAGLLDYGALWLWLPLWGDRVALLVRLLATLAPIGALIGALVGALTALATPLAERFSRKLGGGDDTRVAMWSARLWPLPFVLLAAAPLALIGHLLFSGGKMSRLPARPALEAFAMVALVGGSYVALRFGRPLLRFALRLEGRARWLALSAAYVIAWSLSKLDQRVLPNLYGYLHALLGALLFIACGVFITLLATYLPRVRALAPVRGVTSALLIVVLCAALGWQMATLDRDQNVRVAMFDARAATARSLMLGLVPLVDHFAPARPRVRGRGHTRDHRGELAAMSGLPESPGAHVLFVTVDALRPDHLGAYGYARPTSPRLDALAREGVVFERAYAAAPHSSYSLCSMMASEYLHETLDLGQPLPESTLPKAFDAEGYRTAAFYTVGIFHTEGERLQSYRSNAFGFALHDHTDREADATTDRVLEEVDRVAREGERPTFFWVHYFDVHEPYEDTHFGSADIDRYDGEILKADRAIGRLIDGMEQRLDAKVIVMVSADHGEEFRDHGGVYHGSTLYDEQIRVPLIVRAPGLAPRRVTAPVQTIDIAPTLLGLAGIDAPASFRGRDLRALATGRVTDVGPAYAAVISKRMAVSWPYKIIADLRFGTFELYDLSSDPHERENLAGRRPVELARLQNDVYTWLDSLVSAPGATSAPDPRQLALDRGRLGDRRAVSALADLLLDESAPLQMRRDAARMLGRLADTQASARLLRAMHDSNELVAAEAAIALGRMYDHRAKESLRALVFSEDPDLRTRAAVSLGRLRDRLAVPALIEALWLAETAYDREEAVRWLGRLRDPRAVEPLLALIPEFGTRYLVAVALGQIGDRRVYGALADMLSWERRSNIRDSVVRGLGMLGDPRALPQLVELAGSEPELTFTLESLVRLGALERGLIGGADFVGAMRGSTAINRCAAFSPNHDWDYLNRTTCETSAQAATVRVAVPPALRDAGGAVLVLSARRIDSARPVDVVVTIGGVAMPPFHVDAQWSEQRVDIDSTTLARLHGAATAALRAADPAARLRLDHLLLVPRAVGVAAVSATH